MTLADGSEVVLPFFSATVLWDGSRRPVSVIAAGGPPLLGMEMLAGHRLTMEVVEGGVVRIDTLR